MPPPAGQHDAYAYGQQHRLATHIEEPSTSSVDSSGMPRVTYLNVPGIEDEDHRLRIVRTPTASILEADREDERRRVGKRKRKGTFKRWAASGSKLKRGLSVSTIGTSHHGHDHDPMPPGRAGSGIAQAGLAMGGFGELGRVAAANAGGPAGEPVGPNTRTADQEQDAKAEQFHTPVEEGFDTEAGKSASKKNKRAAELRRRRNVYLNMELPMTELDKYGQPTTYARNKVRTSKYTLWTFLPKNLGEQFRRVANLYFLGLIVLQVFPIFGGASPVLAMLPLLAILVITGVKDGVEDYRRQQLDEAVNNSAVTRLGDWRNVNLPSYTRGFFARLLGLSGGQRAVNRSAKVSKGVRKLREKEGSFSADFLYEGGAHSSSVDLEPTRSNGSAPGAGRHINSLSGPEQHMDANGNVLETLDSHSDEDQISSASHAARPSAGPMGRHRSNSFAMSLATTARSMPQKGVVDYQRASPGTAKWERTLWKKLEVGDVVLLRENDQIPADIVVLSTSDADGQCFVETKNLDGETNLKPRRALKATMGIQHEEDVEHAQFLVDSEPPHANLYSYNGVLRYFIKGDLPGREHPVVEHAQMQGRQEKQEAITINELLLRGCAIRNTTWIIGLIVYTGADTKIMLNQGETPSKRSKIEKETNFNVIANFLILLAICIACAIANGLFLAETDTSAYFYERGVAASSSNVVNAIITFGACLIVFQNIVPISLIITVELVKTIQAIFIYQDIEMWYEPLDHPCVPKTWNISDDLGQIEYIFSDKTGTLTQNIMEFKKCSINGISYGEGVTEAMLGAAKREGRDTSAFDPAADAAALERSKTQMVQMMNTMFKNRYLREDKLTFISPKIVEDLGNKQESVQRQNIITFFRALAVCHTVLGDRFDPDNQNLIEYKAESPDEAALVAAARDVGFAFVQRQTNEIEIEVMGQPERYKPLRVLEFNSSRKRMSVIVRQPDGRILMICKGADSVIYQRLRPDHSTELKDATNRDMEEFANSGLRTLCIAYKYLSEEEFASWATIYDAACAAVTDREDEIEKACEFIEHGLTILGATALEDKLQVGVPDAIAQLHKAGIKLWILTGDKVQTAIEIGFSCNLLTSDMEIMIISSESESGARTQIESGLDKINQARADPSLAPKDGFAVVIDGETLRFALDPSLKGLFLDFTTQCSAVVCCRVSPSQKALTVKLVKDGRNAMTLAIGDGANDVAMIQEAHIGVGIAGLEGAQASMSADYAIGQFRFLQRLLLVHGRWCYIRVAEMHANFFYKNIVWVFAMFWYQLFCNFDGGYLFDYTLVLLYNLAFTSLPVIVMGAFDQDIDAKVSLAYPQLYKRGIKGLEYSRTVFWTYMLDGLYQSAVCFFLPFIVYQFGITATGQGYGMDGQVEFGTTVAAAAVITVTLFVGLNNSYHTSLMIAVLVISALLLYIWVAIYSAFPYSFNNLVVILFSTFDFWALIVIVQIVALGPRYIYKYVQSNYWPIDNNIIREAAVVHRLADKLADAEHGDFNAPPHSNGDSKRGQTPAPRINVPISESPVMGMRRTPSPMPGLQMKDGQQVEMAEFSQHAQRPPAFSAIPIAQHSPSKASRHRVADDTYAEVGEEALASPTSARHLNVYRDRQHSGTPLSPSLYASPPESPAGSRAGMRREGSTASFATATSEPYSDGEGDQFAGYAR